jgi:hypothetical protein
MVILAFCGSPNKISCRQPVAGSDECNYLAPPFSGFCFIVVYRLSVVENSWVCLLFNIIWKYSTIINGGFRSSAVVWPRWQLHCVQQRTRKFLGVSKFRQEILEVKLSVQPLSSQRTVIGESRPEPDDRVTIAAKQLG